MHCIIADSACLIDLTPLLSLLLHKPGVYARHDLVEVLAGCISLVSRTALSFAGDNVQVKRSVMR